MYAWLKRQMVLHRQFIRFFITVALAYLVYLLSYLLMSRVLFPEGNRVWQSVVAICLGDGFNFWLNRRWTFQAKGSYARHLGRFIVVAASSLVLQSILFWVGRTIFHLYDLILVVLLPVLRALYNYFLHKIYTFREHAGK